MTTLSFSRGQMVREASLTEADLTEVVKCRRDHNRLGFAYQVGFVRLFSRFPAQQPLEICDELLSFVAMQLNIDAIGIDGYAARQHTVSDHQARISREGGRRRNLGRRSRPAYFTVGRETEPPTGLKPVGSTVGSKPD